MKEKLGLNSHKCGCKTKILLADDNSFNLLPLVAMLDDLYGFDCDTAEDGVKELDKFKENYSKTCCDKYYKIVLTDINMPNMDGVEASIRMFDYAKQIR